MSSRRLQEDYRRILGITEDIRGIDPALPRMRIAGARGIYQQGDGTRKSGAAPSEDTDPVTPDETDTNSNEDGSGQGDQNTGDGIGGGGDDGSDFIIDPEDPPAGVDVNSDTFGSNWASGGVKSFVDCNTNKCIELVEVGGYVPPSGWDDADTPPIDGTWEQGYFYRSNVDGGVLESFSPASLFSMLPATRVIFGTVYEKRNYTQVTPPNYQANYRKVGGLPNEEITIFMVRNTCVSGSQQSICPSEAPILSEFWPADDCIQLAPNSEGNWEASNRENPADMMSKYSEAKSVLNLCNSAGEPIDIYQRVGGGFVYFNQTQGIWAGSDSSGRMRSFGSSSTLDQEIARPRN